MADLNEITVEAEINQCNVFENQTVLLNEDGTLHLVKNGAPSRTTMDNSRQVHAGETKKKGAESTVLESVASTLSAPQNPEFLRLFQEQMINNQKMFFEQQKVINSLSQSVAEMKNHVAEKRTTTSDTGAHAHSEKYYDSVSEEESDYESDISDEPATKRIKTSSSKIDKLKKVESIFSKQKKLGPSVHAEIAKIVNSGAESVDHKSKDVQELFDKYDRPENCEFLEVPKVNKVLWTSKDIGKSLKDSDRGLQRTQGYLVKGLIPLVTLMNKSLNSSSEESEEIFELSLDALNLLLYAHRDLSSQRRKLLTPALDKKYVALGNDGEKMSANYLFGEQEDLEKRMKEIDDSVKLGKKMKGKDFHFMNKEAKKDGNDSLNTDTFEDRQFRKKPSFKSTFLARRAQHHQNKKKGKKPKGGLGHQK